MKTTKISSSSSSSPKKDYSEIKNSLLNYSRKSGIALRTDTVNGLGVYPVSEKPDNKGTPILISFVFKALKGEKGKKIPAEIFAGKLREIASTGFKGITFPENYGNAKTVTSRILSEVKKGNILSFAIKE